MKQLFKKILRLSARPIVSLNKLAWKALETLPSPALVAHDLDRRVLNQHHQTKKTCLSVVHFSRLCRSQGCTSRRFAHIKNLELRPALNRALGFKQANGNKRWCLVDMSPETSPPLETLAGARISLVDGDAINHTLLQAWLHRVQAVTVYCDNGQEAIDELAKPSPLDAVLMDMLIPVMYDLGTTRPIHQPQHSQTDRRHLTTLLVVGISTHASSEDAARRLASGMTDSLTKPLFWTVAANRLPAEVVSALKAAVFAP